MSVHNSYSLVAQISTFRLDFLFTEKVKSSKEIVQKQRQRQQIGTAAGTEPAVDKGVVQRLRQGGALFRRRGQNGGSLCFYEGCALGAASGYPRRGGMGKDVAALRQTSAQRRQQHREGEQRPLVGVDAAGGTEHGGLGLQPCRL